jgi:hypothetical protein
MSTETNGNERKNGCAAGYPVGLLTAVWCGSGEKRPQGYAWQLDGCGGVRVAGARHNRNGWVRKRTETYGEMECRGITRGFAMPLFVLARGEDVPLSSATVTAARLVRVSRRARGLSGE